MNANIASRTRPSNLSTRDVSREIRNGPHQVVDAGHSQVATWRFGSGPNLVFIHGWPLHAATFRHLVPALSCHFTCHLIDLPFAGQTQTDDEAVVSLTDYADTIARVVDALGIDAYGFVAHDSGALMARIVAARHHRSRVQAIVMGNTEIPGHTPWQLRVYLAAARLPGGGALLRWSLRRRFIRHSNLGYGACFVDPAYADGDFGRWFVDRMVDGSDQRAMKLLQHISVEEMKKLEQTHAEIVAPVRLVWGDLDPFFPIGKAREMLGQFGGTADLRVIEGGKLFAHEDRAEDFLEHAVPFLREHLG